MKPVCDRSGYQDGHCKAIGNWHLSHPHYVRQNRFPEAKVRYAFFYCGRANHNRALLNDGHSHRWTRDNWERDANFMKKYGTFKYKGYNIKRVQVKGRMISQNI